jgi:excisionase family DNA binding protein
MTHTLPKKIARQFGVGRVERVFAFMRSISSGFPAMVFEYLRGRVTLLITTEVMNLLGVSKNTLCKWVRECGLPAFRMPDHSYRFDPVQLLQWLENRQL